MASLTKRHWRNLDGTPAIFIGSRVKWDKAGFPHEGRVVDLAPLALGRPTIVYVRLDDFNVIIGTEL